MKVDAKKLKSKLTIEDHKKIMDALDIPIFAETDKEIRYWTGDKNKDPYKGSAGKLIFYKDSKSYMGFTAGCSYDIIGLCQKRLGLLGKKSSFIDALNFILATTGIEPNACQRITQKQSYNWEDDLGKYLRFRSNGSFLKTYDTDIIDELSKSIPLDWIDEGISAETLQKYQIGYYDRFQQTTIPCFGKNGELYGIRCRNWNPDKIEQAKYIPLTLLNGTTYSFPTNKLFYGINYNWASIEDSKQVILVEGEKSVLKADTFFGEKSNVLALYGSNLGVDRRNEIIKMGVEEVVVALDSDYHVIGDDEYLIFEDKIKKFAKAFQGYCKVTVCYNNIGLDGYKCSPFDFDKNTFYKLFENREVIY